MFSILRKAGQIARARGNFCGSIPNFNSLVRTSSCKEIMDEKLRAVPLVEIDEGIFKYVLIRVYAKQQPDGREPNKCIVRGNLRAEWHSDIYEEVSTCVAGLGLETECLGGGRIEHRPQDKKIKVYGHSTGYGKADHAVSREILKTKYCDYDIEISDEGY